MPDTQPTPFRYTPYDGSKRPFTIGLEPLDPKCWIEPDDRLLPELALKETLIASKRDIVFRERDDTRASQATIRDALTNHLLVHHCARYRRHGDAVVIDDGARCVVLTADAPLLTASRLMQDDLCVMRRCDDGWRLVAASLCFPSSWSLAEKFDRPMSAIHAHVPGFAGQMEQRVQRIFDNLQPDAPVWRLNWSIHSDGDLHHPVSRPWRRSETSDIQPFVRIERQTLTKMPESGDILFTIRIYSDPVVAFAAHPRGEELATGLRTQLLNLDEAQLRYKNLLDERDRIAAALAVR